MVARLDQPEREQPGPGRSTASPSGAPDRSDRILTIPNVITVVRLGCLPVYLWLLFGRDDRVAAAALLAVLGATDFADGYIARHFNQVSELGKVLDPVADRLLFIVGAGAIIIDGSVPLWFGLAVVLREVLVGGSLVVLSLCGMQRFDVSWWGKAGTFALMFSFPCFLLANAGLASEPFWQLSAWGFGLPGLLLSWYAAFTYVPVMRRNLVAGRAARRAEV